MYPDSLNVTFCDLHTNCDKVLTFVCSAYPNDSDIGIIKSSAGNYCEVLWSSGVISFCSLGAMIILSEVNI